MFLFSYLKKIRDRYVALAYIIYEPEHSLFFFAFHFREHDFLSIWHLRKRGALIFTQLASDSFYMHLLNARIRNRL